MRGGSLPGDTKRQQHESGAATGGGAPLSTTSARSERACGFSIDWAGVIDELFVAEQKFSVQTTNTPQPELRYSHFYFFFY